MAQVLNQDELNKILTKHDNALIRKTEKQAIQGKDFELDAKGYGPGIVPEGQWKAQKKAGES